MTVVYLNGKSSVVSNTKVTKKILDATGYSYSKGAYDFTADALIKGAEKTLKGLGISFDSMVGVGLSGHLVLPVLARHFDVPFFAVRKREASSHMGGSPGEGYIGKRWLLVDDFTCTGKTIRTAKQAIETVTGKHNFKTEYVGMYAYSDTEFHFPNGERKQIEQITYGGETVYVNANIYWRVRDLMGVAFQKQMPNPKTYVMETIRIRKYGWDLDEVSMIAVAIEPEVRAIYNG